MIKLSLYLKGLIDQHEENTRADALKGGNGQPDTWNDIEKEYEESRVKLETTIVAAINRKRRST